MIQHVEEGRLEHKVKELARNVKASGMESGVGMEELLEEVQELVGNV